MFKTMKKRIKNEKGLTLIELLAVIVILAIVAAIAVPAIGNIIENSRSKAIIADATNIMSGAQLYFTDNPGEDTFTNTSGSETAGLDDFIESKGKIITFTVKKESPNKITFTADVNGVSGVTFSDLTQDKLNSARVSKGVITIDSTNYGGSTP
ncbi:type II secretion system protein [Metasolibacillus meyeri]|uniref:type II secretion system protein n=1 Tax=Metasolibacillus meyeri TaxID=1071052 RepID=UPI00187D49BE|nr:prepilin-type N-terminal cleavage/methylation domain-containing protein [Metasolibacillus meyeri]